MFKGNYHFFDYKYNIIGYSGQDFGGTAQYLYAIISIFLLIILISKLKNISKKKVVKIIKFVSIFLIIFYFVKTIWESIYDVKITGSFNTGLLPLDTCSLVMIAGLIAGFNKDKVKDFAACWLTTGGIVGGISTLVMLNAFKYYPFWSFGAFYSMSWHFLMLFLGLLLIATNYVEVSYSTIIKGFIFHLILSLIVIPIDFIFNFDFMMYLNLGGIPIFEDVASYFSSINLKFLNPILMLILYFAAFNVIFLIHLCIKKLKFRKD